MNILSKKLIFFLILGIIVLEGSLKSICGRILILLKKFARLVQSSRRRSTSLPVEARKLIRCFVVWSRGMMLSATKLNLCTKHLGSSTRISMKESRKQRLRILISTSNTCTCMPDLSVHTFQTSVCATNVRMVAWGITQKKSPSFKNGVASIGMKQQLQKKLTINFAELVQKKWWNRAWCKFLHDSFLL